MTVLFVLTRIVLGAVLTWEAVKYLDPYVRQTSIANARYTGFRGPNVAFISAGLMMLIGGVFILLGVGAGPGVTLAVMVLLFSAVATHPFWRVDDLRERRKMAIRFVRNTVLAAAAALLLLVPQPWPYSFVN